MAGSSPARRDSQQWSSPQRTDLSDIFCEDRNSEARHKLLLETAKREHERVRAEAERVYREHLQKEERQRLLEEERKEKERIRLEEQIAAERRRLQELKATRVPIPELPEPKPEPVPQPTAGREAAAAPAQPSQAPATAENQAQAAAPSSRPDPGPASSSRGPPAPDRIQDPTRVDAAPSLFARPTSSAAQAPPAQGTPPTTTQRSQPPPSVHSAQPLARQDTTAPQANGAPSSSSTTHAALGPSSTPAADRYLVVHRNLKELRKSMDLQLRTNAALKARLGDMRREIRKTVGQLTTGLGANRTQSSRLNSLLKEALSNPMQSLPVDPNDFVLQPRHPGHGPGTNDAAQLPSVFIYLLNIFSKAVINQFINEGGAKPETADPIGVVVAGIYSEPDFAWRGASLIDIFIAKYRVACPVLFGHRGSEKTEQGRRSLGWKRDGGGWMGEQQHMDRMTGLGAGFAAVALRNFGKSKKQNPYPPSHYWTALARIVNTPAAEISNTQCVVLKAMIQNYEKKFLEAYGDAAVAALRLALVEFPARTPEKSAAINSLQVLAQLLRRDKGLVLE